MNALIARVAGPAALVLLVVVQVVWASWITLGGRPGVQPGHSAIDFAVFYVAGRALTDGADPYAFSTQDWESRSRADGAVTGGPYRYPPLTAAAIGATLGRLPFLPALTVWLGITIALFTASGILLSLALRGRALDPVILLMLAAYGPVWNTLTLGQANALALFGAVTFIFFSVRARDRLAGSALGLSLVLKPLALPLAGAVALRLGWRAIAGIALGIAAGMLAGIALVGPTPAIDYLASAWRVSTATEPIVTSPDNQSLAGVVSRVGLADLYARERPDDAVARAVGLGGGLVLLAGAVALGWARRSSSVAWISMTLVAGNLAAPVSYYHHLVLSYPAMAVAWIGSGPRMRAAVVAALVAVDLWGYGPTRRLIADQPLLVSLPACALLFLYAVCAVRVLRTAAPRGAPDGTLAQAAARPRSVQ